MSVTSISPPSTHLERLKVAARSQASRPQWQPRASDPNLLSPDDAFYAGSPPRKSRAPSDNSELSAVAAVVAARGAAGHRRGVGIDQGRSPSRHRRRKGVWKKLMWVKQSYPDNYTDKETFLEHLQRNPRLQLYDFWPLVADSTVIVQHVCSVIIFVCCFVGIFQERISPVTVVSLGSLSTVLGWILWDCWVGRAEVGTLLTEVDVADDAEASIMSATSSVQSNGVSKESEINGGHGLGLTLGTASLVPRHSLSSATSPTSPVPSPINTKSTFGNGQTHSSYGSPKSRFSVRNQQRLETAKSAVLIYCALLGLSPILKSLTKSTTSDSIWAMSCWLMFINVFFFDYGGGVGVKFPASLSTNAALMASTVLASRLPSTTHVFSLTLFSIEVFGLFPAFRRHLRHVSWGGHLALTICLVVGAGGGLGAIISGGGWKGLVGGIVLGGMITMTAIGGCSWWLIGLQKYKNEIHGPWDPARPIIRRNWD
ncbi:MAG: hypothetical protein M1814_006693 [Vezdaea aestivalis]|nr:MAG: hypothetical protein M1814_006693 [Vezdaea aestivalis]